MTNRLIAIYDGETDTFIQREATNQEQTEIDERESKAAADLAEKEAAQSATKSAKEAILAKIGLTEEEAIILLTPEPVEPMLRNNG
tara:strand:+ start:835 stop:1092 length:258 start_codon:yes stop_codon:yes gene_type:complete